MGACLTKNRLDFLPDVSNLGSVLFIYKVRARILEKRRFKICMYQNKYVPLHHLSNQLINERVARHRVAVQRLN